AFLLLLRFLLHLGDVDLYKLIRKLQVVVQAYSEIATDTEGGSPADEPLGFPACMASMCASIALSMSSYISCVSLLSASWEPAIASYCLVLGCFRLADHRTM